MFHVRDMTFTVKPLYNDFQQTAILRLLLKQNMLINIDKCLTCEWNSITQPIKHICGYFNAYCCLIWCIIKEKKISQFIEKIGAEILKMYEILQELLECTLNGGP